jgi:hypothetical protein
MKPNESTVQGIRITGAQLYTSGVGGAVTAARNDTTLVAYEGSTELFRAPLSAIIESVNNHARLTEENRKLRAAIECLKAGAEDVLENYINGGIVDDFSQAIDGLKCDVATARAALDS